MKIIYFTHRSIQKTICMQWNISFSQVAWKRSGHTIPKTMIDDMEWSNAQMTTHDKTDKWFRHDQITSIFAWMIKIQNWSCRSAQQFFMTPLILAQPQTFMISLCMLVSFSIPNLHYILQSLRKVKITLFIYKTKSSNMKGIYFTLIGLRWRKCGSNNFDNWIVDCFQYHYHMKTWFK